MNIRQFVVELFHQNVKLWVEGDACGGQSLRLCVDAPEGVLTPETRDLLAKNKAELILLLQEKNTSLDTDLPPSKRIALRCCQILQQLYQNQNTN